MEFTRLVAVAFTAIALAGCHHSPTQQEQHVMAQLEASLAPQCIGRYVADLPKDFAWRRPDLTLYYGKDADFKTLEVQVISQHTTLPKFEARVGATKKKIADRVLFQDQSKSLLLAAVKESAEHAIMLRYYSDESGIGIDHQLHLMVGDAHVLIKGSSFEGSSTDTDNMSPAVEARMLELAKHIRSVTDPEQAGPGFCMGSVVVDSDNDYESALMDFTTEKYPDLDFQVWMTNQDNPEDTLHQRLSRVDSLADGHRLTIIRSGSTTVAEIPAQEELAKIVEDRTEYQFVVEPRPKQPSFANEGMQISLDTGVQLADGRYLSSTLTQDEAIALWDAIIKSFRPRPGAVRGTAGK